MLEHLSCDRLCEQRALPPGREWLSLPLLFCCCHFDRHAGQLCNAIGARAHTTSRTNAALRKAMVLLC